jgi:hypothetical protein
VYEPERVQLCAQALILEENGYRVTRGVIYFVASRQRVEVAIDDALRARTRALLAELRDSAARAEPPPPLVDSPKCPRCSLVGICLPDEVNLLRADEPDVPVRRLVPARDDALAAVRPDRRHPGRRRGDELHIETRDGEDHRAPRRHLAGRAVRQRAGLDPGAARAVRSRGHDLLSVDRRLVLRHGARHGPQERRAATATVRARRGSRRGAW